MGISAPMAVFIDPISQLSSLSPYVGLAAANPVAALTAGSPTLQMFNPAVNPQAAFLAFDPASAQALAVAPELFGVGYGPYSAFGNQFGPFDGFGAGKFGGGKFGAGKFSPFMPGKFGPSGKFGAGKFSPVSKVGAGKFSPWGSKVSFI